MDFLIVTIQDFSNENDYIYIIINIYLINMENNFIIEKDG